MTFPNQVQPAEDPLLPPKEPIPAHSYQASGLKRIFIRSEGAGASGLRAGWRILIFLALLGTLLGGLVLVAKLLKLHAGAHPPATITPLLLGGNDLIVFLLLCVATLIMSRLEHGKFGAYGLPLRQALGRNFWIGCLTGFLTISGTLLAMFLLHGFRVTGLALHGEAIFSSLTAWGVTFLIVGLFEEFLCRGYLQYTLASGIGFWPAAFAMSGVFALGHVFNSGETVAGVAAIVLYGLLLCLFLRGTGNLWYAVGFHAAYDWGEAFYGVSDSGTVPYHNLLRSAMNGPRWLTGGSVGPEASVLTPIALLIVGLTFSYFYRENRYQGA